MPFIGFGKCYMGLKNLEKDNHLLIVQVNLNEILSLLMKQFNGSVIESKNVRISCKLEYVDDRGKLPSYNRDDV